MMLAVSPLAAQSRARTRQNQQRPSPSGATPGEILIRFEGTLRFASKKEIRIDVEGDQELEFRVIRKTSFYRGKTIIAVKDLAVDRLVLIEGRKELTGELVAVIVHEDEPSNEAAESKDEKKP